MRILKFLPSQININYKNICRIASNRNLIVEEFLISSFDRHVDSLGGTLQINNGLACC